jgi:hypothetical protein
MPRLRIPRASQLDIAPPKDATDAHLFKKGRSKTGGRARGEPNVVTRTIREGIIAGLNAAGGVEGVAAYVTRVALEDYRLGVAMMALVTPRQADVTIRNEPLVTIEDLDRSLIAKGLPPTAEAFRLEYTTIDADEDVTEVEVVEAEITSKK